MRVKGGDKLVAPDIFVSESELDVNDKTIKAVLVKMGIDYVLHHLWGFDNTLVFESTGTFYEKSECQHRTRGGKLVEGVRYSGKERLDDDWILKGNPSEEAEVISKQDISLVREMQKLGRQMKSC